MKKAIILLIILAAIITYMTLPNGETIFEASVLDQNSQVIHEQQTKTSNGIAQSFITTSLYKAPIWMQSSIPLDKQAEKTILKATIKNPFGEQAQLLRATTYKNQEIIATKKFIEFYLGPSETYIYKTPELEIKGLEAQINEIKIVFYFKLSNGQTSQQEFKYSYLYLTKCQTDNDCPTSLKCDIGNQARFSTTKYTYCAKNCISNQQCKTGQVCILGFCGY